MLTDMYCVPALLFGILTVHALESSNTFHYVKYPRLFRRNEVACRICYGQFDCFNTDRCEYEAAVAELLAGDDDTTIVNEPLKKIVDSMMYDLLLEDSLKEYEECIPLISSYSTCNKDNICLGCKSCDCDEHGHWNCTDMRKCSHAPVYNDDRLLASVMDSLKEVKYPARYKRAYLYSEEPAAQSIFEEFERWIVTERTANQVIKETTSEKTRTTVSAVSSSPPVHIVTDEDNADNNLAFDEILGNDNIEHVIESTEKDVRNYPDDGTHQFLQDLEKIEEGRDDKVLTYNSHLNIDLLKDLKRYLQQTNANETSNDETNSINDILNDTGDSDSEKLSSPNSDNVIRQRNVRAVNQTTTRNVTEARNITETINKKETRNMKETRNTTKRKSNILHNMTNTTHPDIEIEHIADVITVMINNEHKEINNLNYVKKSLMNFRKKYNFNSSKADEKHDNEFHSETQKQKNWTIDMLRFYVNNLKKDVKDTLKDIYAIQKLEKLGVGSYAENLSNLKELLMTLTSYYMKNFRGNRTNNFNRIPKSALLNNVSSIKSKNILPNKHISLSANSLMESDSRPQRRVLEPTSIFFYNVEFIKRALARMLGTLDRKSSLTNALGPLSPSTKKMFYRFIKKQYTEDYSVINTSIRDTDFNLTEILTKTANDFNSMAADFNNINPADRLSVLKLLHLTLSQGVDKIKDALTSIQIGYSRRMNFIEENVGNELVADVSKHLTAIERTLNKFVTKSVTLKLKPERRRQSHDKTGSLWHNIKDAFSNSKSKLVNYFQKKFKPTSYIVNEQVKKRAEEVNKQKFLDIMKKWQLNLDMQPTRRRRSVKRHANRMKNILPKYLRGINRNSGTLNKVAPVNNNDKLIKINKVVPVNNNDKLIKVNKVVPVNDKRAPVNNVMTVNGRPSTKQGVKTQHF